MNSRHSTSRTWDASDGMNPSSSTTASACASSHMSRNGFTTPSGYDETEDESMWEEEALTNRLDEYPVLDWCHYEDSQPRMETKDTILPVSVWKRCMRLYAESLPRIKSMVRAAAIFREKETLAVKMGNPRDQHIHDLSIEQLLVDQAKVLAVKAEAAGAWQLNQAAKLTAAYIFDKSPFYKEASKDNDDPMFPQKRRDFLRPMVQQAVLLRLLVCSFLRVVSHLSQKSLPNSTNNSSTESVNGKSLQEWWGSLKADFARHYLRQDLTGVEDIIENRSVKQDSSSGSPNPVNFLQGGEALVASIPDQACANERSDNTYGLRGWRWPPLRDTETPLSSVSVDKFLDGNVQNPTKLTESMYGAIGYAQMVLIFYNENIRPLKKIFKAFTTFREKGRLWMMDDYSDTRVKVEQVIRNNAHKIKGGASQLSLFKLWKISRLVELPAKQLDEGLESGEHYTEPERAKVLSKLTKCRNALFLWVQFRNVAALIQKLPRILGFTAEELAREMEDEEFSSEECLIQLNGISPSTFDEYFNDVLIYNPFKDRLWSPSG